MNAPDPKTDIDSDVPIQTGSNDTRPLDDSNLGQVRPGIPWGKPRQHFYTHVRHAISGFEKITAAYHPLNLQGFQNRRIIGFLGSFGSGKTEVAVNFAIQLSLASARPDDPYKGPVRIIDLDIVNPYFRSREAVDPLNDAGVEVVSPSGNEFWADLPIILPEVRGAIKRTDGTTILDVGGDDLGARVLSHIKDDFNQDDYLLLMVVNANRPFTSNPEGARKVLGELESASGLKIGGLVSNTHLMNETTPDEIRRGYLFTMQISELTGLPVLLVSAEARFINGESAKNGLTEREFACPLLPLYRFMLPPWK